MTPAEHAQRKKMVIEEALSRGLTKVFVNTSLPGVQLPKELLSHAGVPLNLSWRFGMAMGLRDDGIYADLTFRGLGHPSFSSVIPWTAIWAFKDVTGMLMMVDMPPSELPDAMLEQSKRLQKIEGGQEITPPRKGHLKLLN